MTKEKIIINEIDVTECTYRRQNPHNFCMCASIINESGNIIELTRYVQCEYNPNCYYKQLKRKEQECNKLYIQLKADEEYYKEEENTLRKIIKNKEERNIELYKENNKLKVKNEKLKESLKVWKYSDVQHIFKINKYERVLTEIKYIAEENIRIADLEGLSGVYRRGLAEQILQKIRECEVER